MKLAMKPFGVGVQNLNRLFQEAHDRKNKNLITKDRIVEEPI